MRLYEILAIGFLITLSQAKESSSQSALEDELQQLFNIPKFEPFDWELFKAFESSDFGNVIISPLSMRILLTVLYEGSSGHTQKELASVLQVPKDVLDLRYKIKNITTSYQRKSDKYTLDMASRIYLHSDIEPRQRFRAIAVSFYDTEMMPLNFNRSHESAGEINDWVKNVTRGKIEEFVSPRDIEESVMILINALYFRGEWTQQFPKNRTSNKAFHVSAKQSVTAPFMSNNGQYLYTVSSDWDAKMLRLPYQGDHLAMYIILPNSKGGLSRLMRDINPQTLTAHISMMNLEKVEVSIPKFKYDFSASFPKILQKLGLHQMFLNSASLPAIARNANRKLKVNDILQKAGIEVNEEGSVAYAATEITLGNKFGAPDYVFDASNPFLYFILDEKTGSVLFMGKIENPVKNEQGQIPHDHSLENRFEGESVPNRAPAPSTITGTEQKQPGTDIKTSRSGRTLVSNGNR